MEAKKYISEEDLTKFREALNDIVQAAYNVVKKIVNVIYNIMNTVISIICEKKDIRKRMQIYYRTKKYRIKKKQIKLIVRGMQVYFI